MYKRKEEKRSRRMAHVLQVHCTIQDKSFSDPYNTRHEWIIGRHAASYSFLSLFLHLPFFSLCLYSSPGLVKTSFFPQILIHSLTCKSGNNALISLYHLSFSFAASASRQTLPSNALLSPHNHLHTYIQNTLKQFTNLYKLGPGHFV